MNAERLTLPSASSQVVSLSVRGTDIRMCCGNNWEQWRLQNFELKEPDLLDWIDQVLSEKSAVFFDIGANVGQYSLFAAKRFPGCKVVAFEPSPHNLASLCDNVLLNALSNVTVCGFPLAETAEVQPLHLSQLAHGASMHAVGSIGALRAFGERPVSSILVGSMALNTLLRAKLVPSPSAMKIDVDGGELSILRGYDPGDELRFLMVETNWIVDTYGASKELARWSDHHGFRLVGQGKVLQRRRMKWQNLYFERS